MDDEEPVLVATTGGLVAGAGTLTWSYESQPEEPWCLVVVSAPTIGTVCGGVKSGHETGAHGRLWRSEIRPVLVLV